MTFPPGPYFEGQTYISDNYIFEYNEGKWTSRVYRVGDFAPGGPPNNASGAIVDIEKSGSQFTLTMASDKYLDAFAGSDPVIMVDANSDTAFGVKQTDTIVSSGSGEAWQQTYFPTGTLQNWNSVAYDGVGRWVAVAQSGDNRIAYSDDATNWTFIASPLQLTWRSVAYGNGRWAILATDFSSTNRVIYSTDGINWSQSNPLPVDAGWWSIAFGDGKFVAVAQGGFNERIMYSTDAITWTVPSGTPELQYSDVVYGGDKWVAIAYAGSASQRVAYSTDAITWNVVGAPPDGWWSIAYGNNLFVATAYFASSESIVPDIWVPQQALDTSRWGPITWGDGFEAGDGAYVCLSKAVNPSTPSTTAIMYSADAETWAAANTPADANQCTWESVAHDTFNRSFFVAVASSGPERLITSADGITWTYGTLPNNYEWRSVVRSGPFFIAVASGGGTDKAIQSEDGLSWTTITQTYPAATNFVDVAYAGGRTGVLDTVGNIMYYFSTNGAWTASPLPSGTYTGLVNNTSSRWIAFGTSLAYSTDFGSNWTTGTNPFGSTPIADAAYGSGYFQLIADTTTGGNSRIAYSTDAINWTLVDTPDSGADFQNAGYGDGRFVISAIDHSTPSSLSRIATADSLIKPPGPGNIMYSSDGITWSEALSGNTQAVYDKGWYVIAFDGTKFVAGSIASGDGAFMYSYNATDWTVVETGFDNYIWSGLAAGDDTLVAVGRSGFVKSEASTVFSSDLGLDLLSPGELVIGGISGAVGVVVSVDLPSSSAVIEPAQFNVGETLVSLPKIGNGTVNSTDIPNKKLVVNATADGWATGFFVKKSS